MVLNVTTTVTGISATVIPIIFMVTDVRYQWHVWDTVVLMAVLALPIMVESNVYALENIQENSVNLLIQLFALQGGVKMAVYAR